MEATPLSRRQFAERLGKGLTGSAAFPFLSDPRLSQFADFLGVTDPLQGKRLYKDLVTYNQMGDHRSATVVDNLTGMWMEAHLRSLGFQTQRQSFPVTHHIVLETTLLAGEFGLNRVEAFPLWPVRFSNAAIIRPLVWYSPLQLQALRGNIALIPFPYSPTGLVSLTISNLIKTAADAGAVAVVGITAGPTGLLTALNPTLGMTPWPIPVVVVGPRDQPVLQETVDSGAMATVKVMGQTSPFGAATNIIGRLQRSVDAPWVVISTPISGWFSSGGERGPGVAMWRGLSRLVASRWLTPPSPLGPVNYLFLATGGHELGSHGINNFLGSGAPPPAKVLLWFHLGAWISTYAWTTPQDGSLPQRLDTDNERFLIAAGFSEDYLSPLSRLPGIIRQVIPAGEIGNIMAAGYPRALTITGRNVPHHTRMDDARCTGPEKLEPVARNISAFLSNVIATLPRP